jgi:hypothetical protein
VVKRTGALVPLGNVSAAQITASVGRGGPEALGRPGPRLAFRAEGSSSSPKVAPTCFMRTSPILWWMPSSPKLPIRHRRLPADSPPGSCMGIIEGAGARAASGWRSVSRGVRWTNDPPGGRSRVDAL